MTTATMQMVALWYWTASNRDLDREAAPTGLWDKKTPRGAFKAPLL